MKLFKRIVLVLALVLGVAVLAACSCKEEKKFSEEKLQYTQEILLQEQEMDSLQESVLKKLQLTMHH